jgi:hypothetical protein
VAFFMQTIFVIGSAEQVDALKEVASNVVLTAISLPNEAAIATEQDALICFDEQYHSYDFSQFKCTVFLNTQQAMAQANVIAFNGWESFWQKNIWEVKCTALTELQTLLLKNIGKKALVQPPQMVGYVSTRVIAMIVNEAYFTLEEGVSTKAEIDVAMKLGTAYPYGPFEWANIIGEKNIFGLLQHLCKSNSIYTPAQLLQNEC